VILKNCGNHYGYAINNLEGNGRRLFFFVDIALLKPRKRREKRKNRGKHIRCGFIYLFIIIIIIIY